MILNWIYAFKLRDGDNPCFEIGTELKIVSVG
jgi:hypothetical protein